MWAGNTIVLFELGSGFAYVGRQYHLEIDNEDFYIDLLFYNLKLRCYVVIELKAKEFKPEYAGKLNFYISAVDNILKTEHDNPTIGLLLCKSKKNTIVEYALKNLNNPIGVSNYELGKPLPKEFEQALPSADEIKSRIGLLDNVMPKRGDALTKPEQRVLEILKSDGTLTAESIAEVIGRKSRAVHDVLRSLREKGIITRVGGNKNGRWIVIRETVLKEIQGETARSFFEKALSALEYTAEALKDTFKEKPYEKVGADGKVTEVIPAFRSSPSDGYYQLKVYAEMFFTPCSDWIKKRYKEIGGENAKRLAEAEWCKAAAEALKQKLTEELDPQFWIDCYEKSQRQGSLS